MPIRSLLLAAALLPAAVAAQQPAPATLPARIDSLAEAFLREAPAAGVTVAAVRGRDTIVLKGYGLADADARRVPGPGTVYRLGSITKQFTAAAILQQVEQGKLRLDDTVGRFLPQYPKWGGVTIRRLLNHTSGIPSYTGSRRWFPHRAESLTPDSILAFVAGDSLDFAVGSAYRYNNSGYMLLGLVLEKVTGMPYRRYVEERLFRPLGLREAHYCPDTPADTAWATGYDRRPDASRAPADRISMSSPWAAGALCMSVRDYLRWQAALTGGRVVRPATFARMSTADTLADGRRIPSGYGWGLFQDTLAGRTLVHHGGDIPGFSAQQLWIPRDSLRVVVFTNTLGSQPDRLARNVARAVLGAPLVQPPRPLQAVPLAAGLRAAIVGTYDVTLPGAGVQPFVVAAAAEGDGVTVQLGAQPSARVVHLGDGTFGAAFDPTLRISFVMDGDAATRVVIRQRGGEFGGPRRP